MASSSMDQIIAPLVARSRVFINKYLSEDQIDASLVDQTCTDLEESLRRELDEWTYEKVDGFWEKYFDKKDWTKRSANILRDLNGRHNGNALRDFQISSPRIKFGHGWTTFKKSSWSVGKVHARHKIPTRPWIHREVSTVGQKRPGRPPAGSS